MASNKILKKLSNEESIAHKILLWIGTHENEIFSQKTLARILEMKRSTLNYHLLKLRSEKIIDKSIQLTDLGKEVFFRIWKCSEMPKLRAHHTQIVYHLSKCPRDYLKKYKNKILQPLTNKKYNGFRFKIRDFNCIFYSEKTILAYVKNIFADSPDEVISAIQIIAQELKEILEIEFEGLMIQNFKMAQIQFGHIAMTNSFLSKKLDSQGYNYQGKNIHVDHSLSLNEAEIVNFKRNNPQDILALEKLDADFQEFMEGDQSNQQTSSG